MEECGLDEEYLPIFCGGLDQISKKKITKCFHFLKAPISALPLIEQGLAWNIGDGVKVFLGVDL